MLNPSCKTQAQFVPYADLTKIPQLKAHGSNRKHLLQRLVLDQQLRVRSSQPSHTRVTNLKQSSTELEITAHGSLNSSAISSVRPFHASKLISSRATISFRLPAQLAHSDQLIAFSSAHGASSAYNAQALPVICPLSSGHQEVPNLNPDYSVSRPSISSGLNS
ncbi:WD repeat-containing protein 91-like [Dorcoceras hygrometricum]|uniref:WD repeat-containing protein 91-like n=1 Tax=Dorcoceras hygrometricum TaxID=472368 RepID=A0A2Z7ADV6_9LAMI|nr:WD repeat-containing protein 91-like [Dorcoceras hygrometricum]